MHSCVCPSFNHSVNIAGERSGHLLFVHSYKDNNLYCILIAWLDEVNFHKCICICTTIKKKKQKNMQFHIVVFVSGKWVTGVFCWLNAICSRCNVVTWEFISLCKFVCVRHELSFMFMAYQNLNDTSGTNLDGSNDLCLPAVLTVLISLRFNRSICHKNAKLVFHFGSARMGRDTEVRRLLKSILKNSCAWTEIHWLNVHNFTQLYLMQ